MGTCRVEKRDIEPFWNTRRPKLYVGCLIFHALCSCLRRHGEDDAEVEKTALLGIGSENHVGAVFQFKLPGGAQTAKGFYLDGFRELEIDNASHVYPRVDEFVDGIGKYLRVFRVDDIEISPVRFRPDTEAQFFGSAKAVEVVYGRRKSTLTKFRLLR